MTELAHGHRRTGTVTSFDEQVGLGVIAGDDGADYRFHCIEIADGTRTIDAATPVRFELLAKFGRWEAAAIES